MQSKLLPTPALLPSSQHALVVYSEVTMVRIRFQHILDFFVGDVAQNHFNGGRCRVLVFDHPITRSPDHEPALRCAEVSTRLSLLAASLLTIFLAGCALGPAAPPTTTTNSTQGLTSINHIVFMAQENRSFDTYF